MSDSEFLRLRKKAQKERDEEEKMYKKKLKAKRAAKKAKKLEKEKAAKRHAKKFVRKYIDIDDIVAKFKSERNESPLDNVWDVQTKFKNKDWANKLKQCIAHHNTSSYRGEEWCTCKLYKDKHVIDEIKNQLSKKLSTLYNVIFDSDRVFFFASGFTCILEVLIELDQDKLKELEEESSSSSS